jgi:hypothetical protein
MFRKGFLSVLGGITLFSLLVCGIAYAQEKEIKVTLTGEVGMGFDDAVKGKDYEEKGDGSFVNISGNILSVFRGKITVYRTYITVTEAKDDIGTVISHMKGNRLEVIGKMIAEVSKFGDKGKVQVKGTVKNGKTIDVTSVTAIK